MDRIGRRVPVVVVLTVAAALGAATVAVESDVKGPEGKPALREVRLRDDLSVRELEKGVWLRTAWLDVPKFGRCPANGLILVDGDDAVLINLPWTDDQTHVLFDWVAKACHATVKTVVPTHWKQDCSGGLGEAHLMGADSLAADLTAEFLKKVGRPTPHRTFTDKTALDCGQTRIELAFVGPGHTLDNIVAWIPRTRILFAGCLVKAQAAMDLGDTADADLTGYPKTLQDLKKLHPDAVTVVPGHGEPGGLELIDHTLGLCAKP
jgi:metallo-beta-lactamase class B